MPVIKAFLPLVLLLGCLPAQAQVILTGTVRDAERGVLLAAAHVVAEEAGRGTITNAEGRFELVVPALPVVVRVRYIGYQTGEQTVEPGDARELDIRLEPAVYQLGEVFVGGEDLATNIMRRVIARKQAQREALEAYAARGYVRLVLENKGDIVLLSEQVFDRYWRREAGPRSVVRSKRETADFYDQLGFSPAGQVVNLYDDAIDIQGLRFIGPTHPDALDAYTFSLAERRSLDDQMVYDLYVAPKSGLEATFIGRLSVLDEEYVLLEADLRPARHVEFPDPVEQWAVFYRQQFAPVDSIWMPVDLHLDGRIHVDPNEAGYPPATLRQVTQLSEYRLNEAGPDAVFARSARVVIDSASVFKDYLFLLGDNIVPLTPRELVALERLRRDPITLARAFPPRRGGLFAAFETQRREVDGSQFSWPVIMGYQPWLRFNRVDGFFFGIGKPLPFSPRLLVDVRAAETSGLRRIRFLGRVQRRWGRGGTVEAGYRRDTSPRTAGSVYTPALASLPSLLGQGDYFDYYWNERGWLRMSYAFPLIRFAIEGRAEQHESLERQQSKLWPLVDHFRSNPDITDGSLRSVIVSAAVGDGAQPFRTGPLRRAEVAVEHSSPSLGGSDFDFTRLSGLVDWSVKTLYPRRLRPNRFHLRAYGESVLRGTLPPQRFGVLDGSLAGFSTFGTLRTLRGRPYEGERYAGLFWAHDFDTLPFEALGLRALVDRKMGVRLFGGHGRTWLDDERRAALGFEPHVPSGWHHELGLSLTNVGGSPFRLDLGLRLDQPGLFVGFGISRFGN